MELIGNVLISAALEIIRAEKKEKKLLFRYIDEHWLINNFIHIMESYINDFWVEHRKS